MEYKNTMCSMLPLEAQALLLSARARKGQGSLEYIMMLSAASIVILIALAMVLRLKGSAISSVAVNGTNMSIASVISDKLASLAANSLSG
ncbi:MAG: hypothetical protein KGH69_00955 [Candidatus Micrarchaeota archaeon]|nr:hypothetical protein [Candidatus Micrarchaeota archaeon]